MVGLNVPRISQIFNNFNIKEILVSYYKKGTPADDLADFYKMDSATLWGILLQDKPDLERYITHPTQPQEGGISVRNN